MRKRSAIFIGALSLLLAFFSAGCGGSTPAISISLTPSATQTIDQGQSVPISASLTNDSSGKGVTWTLAGVGTLANNTTASVTYQAPASVASRATITVTATSVAQTGQTAALSVIVNPAPAITTTSLPQGTAGTAYSFTLNENGGTAPLTWGVVAGQIPPGLTLNTGGGVISGTPTGAGTFNFTVEVSDAANLSATKALSIVINPPPPLTVSTASLATGALNVDYTASLRASGGVPPYSWSLVGGGLPAGLRLTASGVISGTPTATGMSSFTVQVADSEVPTPAKATQALAITINPVPFSIATTSLPNGTVTISYSTTLQASGGVGPITWSTAGGTLPTWASLNPATGVISGTPPSTATGTSSFTVKATDSETPTAAVATQALSITVTGTQNVLLNGHYAFALGGYRAGLAGSFVADGSGNILSGTEDLVDSANPLGIADAAITSGSYAVGIDHRGILTYTDAKNNTFTFDIALTPLSASVATKGAMIQTDSSGDNFTGSLALQDTSAFSADAMSGNYVFDLSGWDSTGNANVVVGSDSVASGAVSSGLLDANDGGTLASNQSFTGTVSVASSGRGTMTSSLAQANFTFYVVSSGKWLAIAIDPATGAVATGLVQQQAAGVYTNSSIDGTMVLQSESATSSLAPQAMLGLLSSPGDGTATLSLDVDEAGALSSASDTGAFTFASSNGRFTLAVQATQGVSNFVGYMVAPNQALIAGTDSIPSLGSFESQIAGPFSNSSLDGSLFFGSQPLVSAPSTSQAPLISSGVMTFDGAGVLSGTTDSQQGGTVTTGQLTGSYTVGSDGRVTLVPGVAILYVVSLSRAYALYVGQPNIQNPFIQVVQR